MKWRLEGLVSRSLLMDDVVDIESVGLLLCFLNYKIYEIIDITILNHNNNYESSIEIT